MSCVCNAKRASDLRQSVPTQHPAGFKDSSFQIVSRSYGSSLQTGTILIFPWRTSESMNQSSSGHHSDSVVVVAAQQKLEGRLGLEHLSPAAARLRGSQLHCRQADRHKNLQPCKMKMSGKRSATFLFFLRLHLNECVREK